MSKRFQTVGSLLRPPSLLTYKRQIEHRDDIIYPFYDNFEGYEACESATIRDVIAKQIQHNLSILTDGEYSRSLWSFDFVWGLKGIRRCIAQRGFLFRDKDETQTYEIRRDTDVKITEPLSGKNHHFIKLFQHLQSLAGDRPTKFTVPSPSHTFSRFLWSDNIGGEASVYANSQELKADLIKSYQEFIEEYAAVGGKILQFDDCTWEIFANDNITPSMTGKTTDQTQLLPLAAEFIEINNTVIDFGHSLGLLMWTHNCRGNYASRHICGGSYCAIADLFLKQLRYDRFFLEWDDERAGSIEALRVFVEREKIEIVIGLLSSKTNTLDDEERVIRLLDEASKIIPKERLLLSHQCGFASCDIGNELTEDEQWAKIDQGQRLAFAYWGE
jgi:methionine synthase II (cobalamin-independent)